MVLGEDGTNSGIQEQNEQQREQITGVNWVPIEDLNTPGDARELLTGGRLYSEDGSEVGDPQQYVDEARETLSDPELNSDLEPQQDTDPNDYEPINNTDETRNADTGSSDPQRVTLDLPGSGPSSSDQSMLIGLLALLAVGAAAYAIGGSR